MKTFQLINKIYRKKSNNICLFLHEIKAKLNKEKKRDYFSSSHASLSEKIKYNNNNLSFYFRVSNSLFSKSSINLN